MVGEGGRPTIVPKVGLLMRTLLRHLRKLDEFVEHDVYLVRLIKTILLVFLNLIGLVVLAFVYAVAERALPDYLSIIQLVTLLFSVVPSLILARSLGLMVNCMLFWRYF